jgi:hypothetical protein
MMMTFLLKATLVVVIGLTGLITGMLLLPHSPPTVLQLITPPPGCALPCWQGIRPDVTPYQEAVMLLQSNPHIVTLDTRQQLYAGSRSLIWYIYWSWRDENDGLISGSLMIRSDIVRLVRIYKTIPFGTVWTLFGQPEEGDFIGTLIYRQSQPVTLPLYHVAIYPQRGVTVSTDADCARFWWQPSVLLFGSVVDSGHSYNLDGYRQAVCKHRRAT